MYEVMRAMVLVSVNIQSEKDNWISKGGWTKWLGLWRRMHFCIHNVYGGVGGVGYKSNKGCDKSKSVWVQKNVVINNCWKTRNGRNTRLCT